MLFDKLIRAVIPQKAFDRSVFTLLSGTVTAMLIAYLAQPILTRIYSPEAFGLFEAFGSIIAILVPFASMRYEDAIMLPEKDEDALPVLGLSLILVFIAITVIGVFVWLSNVFSFAFIPSNLLPWLLFIPPVLLAQRTAKLGELWLNRKKRYRPISAVQAVNSSITAGTRISMGPLISGRSPLGLITGYLAGHCMSLLWYAVLMLRTERHFISRAFRWRSIAYSLRRYRHFPYFSMPSMLLSALIIKLPLLLLLYFFDEAVVGFLGRAFALFMTPLSLVGGAVAQVFFIEGVEAYRAGKLSGLIRTIHARLLMIGLFPTIGVMIAGPQVFGFILGNQWYVTGEYLQWIAPWLFLSGIASPLTRTFDILERQRVELLTTSVMFVLQTSALVIGAQTGDILICLLYMSLAGCLSRVIQLIALLYLGQVSFRGILKDYISHGVVTLPFAAMLLGITYVQNALISTVAFVVFTLMYLGLCFKYLHRG